jgi:hypothetical protein
MDQEEKGTIAQQRRVRLGAVATFQVSQRLGTTFGRQEQRQGRLRCDHSERLQQFRAQSAICCN